MSRAIVVVQQHMTPFARQSLLETERSKYHIEQFHEQARASTRLVASERASERGLSLPRSMPCPN